jgi:hypothetical protein
VAAGPKTQFQFKRSADGFLLLRLDYEWVSGKNGQRVVITPALLAYQGAPIDDGPGGGLPQTVAA